MQTIKEVVAQYDAQAQEYFQRTVSGDLGNTLKLLTQHCAPGSLIVDAGCGSGRDTLWLCEQGFRVYSYDASSGLCALAQALVDGRTLVHCHRHDQLTLPEPAEGIWASASLLFLSDEDLSVALRTFAHNLAPGGTLFLSFKAGQGWQRADNKWFRHLDPADMDFLASQSGLRPLLSRQEPDLFGRSEGWTNFLLRKPA